MNPSCNIRRALYARIDHKIERIGAFQAAFFAFDAHVATCPLCRKNDGDVAPASWRRRGVKRLTWRYRFPVRAYNVRYGLHKRGWLMPLYQPASIWYRMGGNYGVNYES